MIDTTIKLKQSIVFKTILYIGISSLVVTLVIAAILFYFSGKNLERQIIKTGYSFLDSFIEQSKDSISKGQREPFQYVMDNIAKINEIKETSLYSFYGLMIYKSNEVTIGYPFTFNSKTGEFMNPNKDIYQKTKGRYRREDWNIRDIIDRESTKQHVSEETQQGRECADCHYSVDEEALHFDENGKGYLFKEHQIDFVYKIPVERQCVVCHTNWKQNQTAGYLSISMDKDYFDEQKKETFYLIIYVIFAIFATLIVLLIIVFKITLFNPLSKFIQNFGDLARGEGDLSRRLEIKSIDEVGVLSAIFNEFVVKMSGMLKAIKSQILLLDSSTEEISSAVCQQSASTIQQSSSVTEITSTMEELSASSREIANSSEEVVKIAAKSLNETKEGLEGMESLLGKMTQIDQQSRQNITKIVDLGKKSNEITEVMELINKISDQTKLIAFNAALEASSAGAAGKRFNVVAVEIRRLADNVMESTGEIGKKITEIQESVSKLIGDLEANSHSINEGMKYSNNVVEMMQQSLEAARLTTDAAKQISLSTNQQKSASDQVVFALREINDGSTQSAESIKMIEKITIDISSMSKELKKQVSHFRLDADSTSDENKNRYSDREQDIINNAD